MDNYEPTVHDLIAGKPAYAAAPNNLAQLVLQIVRQYPDDPADGMSWVDVCTVLPDEKPNGILTTLRNLTDEGLLLRTTLIGRHGHRYVDPTQYDELRKDK